MKCVFCETVGDNMPTIAEFRGIEVTSETDLRICDECQHLSLPELTKLSQAAVRRMALDAVPKLLAKKSS